MSTVTTKVNRIVSIEAKVIRANGTVEDLGVIYSEGFLNKLARLAKKFINP